MQSSTGLGQDCYQKGNMRNILLSNQTQPIIKIRHKDLSFEEADELTEHYINKESETEIDDSEWEKTALSRSERAKKRLVPQLASLPQTTQYSLAITSSLPGNTLENENPPNNMDGEINEIMSKANTDIIADTDHKYQSYSVIKGADGTTMFIAPENFSSPNEQIFQVENIQDAQTTNTQSSHHHCVSSQQFGALYASVVEIRNYIEELKTSVKGLGDVLTQILTHTSNVNRYITDYLKKVNESNERESISTHPTEEDFSDLESKPKFKTTQDLEEFERLLEDKSYQDRFIRFLKTKFKMNSHENGQTFFTMVIIRLLTDPSLFLPYSWKGLQRKDTHNLSFEGKHKVFTAFMFRIVRIADHTKVQTDVDKMFENLLRFKKVNNRREVFRTKPSRKPSSRSRPKGLKYKAESEAGSIDEAE